VTASESTTARLARSALELFEEQGYNQTDVDQIAQRASTSRRTFFRHFDSKDDAILRAHRGRIAKFRTLLPDTPSLDSAIALRDVIDAADRVLADIWIDPDGTRRRYALVFGTDVLRERMAATDLAYMGAVEDQLAPSLGAIRAAMIAAAGVAMVNSVLQQLGAGAAVDHCRSALASGFTDLRSAVNFWMVAEPANVVVIPTNASAADVLAALAHIRA
jgi:AcrR family transcriptional regulator